MTELQDMAENEKGISSTTIAILIILALLITIIGTWAVLNSINTVPSVEMESGNTNVGRVSLTILPSTPPVSSDSGKVTLDITK